MPPLKVFERDERIEQLVSQPMLIFLCSEDFRLLLEVFAPVITAVVEGTKRRLAVCAGLLCLVT